MGFSGGVSGKEYSCQCRRHKRCWFDPWVGKIPWRRAWQPTPVFFPGEFHGQRSLVAYSPWGPKESDTTEQLSTAQVMLQQNFTKRREMEMGTAWPTSGNTELHQSGPTYLPSFTSPS